MVFRIIEELLNQVPSLTTLEYWTAPKHIVLACLFTTLYYSIYFISQSLKQINNNWIRFPVNMNCLILLFNQVETIISQPGYHSALRNGRDRFQWIDAKTPGPWQYANYWAEERPSFPCLSPITGKIRDSVMHVIYFRDSQAFYKVDPAIAFDDDFPLNNLCVSMDI